MNMTDTDLILNLVNELDECRRQRDELTVRAKELTEMIFSLNPPSSTKLPQGQARFIRRLDPVIEDKRAIPEEFLHRTPHRAAIGSALRAGHDVPGARLQEVRAVAFVGGRQ